MHDFGLDREHMQVPQGNLDPSCCEATKRKKREEYSKSCLCVDSAGSSKGQWTSENNTYSLRALRLLLNWFKIIALLLNFVFSFA